MPTTQKCVLAFFSRVCSVAWGRPREEVPPSGHPSRMPPEGGAGAMAALLDDDETCFWRTLPGEARHLRRHLRR
eukprot:scaffold112723_cov24-Phaeocystis_antarctica.AAC.1